MTELVADQADTLPSVVEFAPPDIARRHIAAWNVTERAEWHDGETLVEDLPASTLHEFSRKLSLVPAGHRFFDAIFERLARRTTWTASVWIPGAGGRAWRRRTLPMV